MTPRQAWYIRVPLLHYTLLQSLVLLNSLYPARLTLATASYPELSFLYLYKTCVLVDDIDVYLCFAMATLSSKDATGKWHWMADALFCCDTDASL